MQSIRSQPPPGRLRWALLPLAAVAIVLAVAGRFGDSNSQTGQHYALDTTGYPDLASLASESQLVVLGRSDGNASIRAVLADGILADFEQRVTVSEVIKGQSAAEITIIRLGPNPAAEEGVEPMDAGEAPAGSVPAGDYLLFLEEGGAPDSWSVMGHDQGAMEVGSDGRVRSAFPEINGLAVGEVIVVMRELAR